ncbi:uncharacterized protein LOC114725875 [Neltuma alba]|uniref:uncharacterized protein LOC114725875 n=1 Tax=Neltuma alba TaxID=207710 RepID=UPI0010A4F870|nr:uncharacterized protein LOC114725875 [Prosopis alba]
MALVYVFRFVQLFHFVLVLSAGYGYGKHDDKCPPSFDCGNLGSLRFPFTKHEQTHCGLFAVRGCDGPSLNKTIQLQKNGRTLQLTNVVQQEKLIITVFDPDRHRTCDVASNCNMLFPQNSPLASFRFEHNVESLFRCKHDLHFRPPPWV